jgi:hypothetical protein
MATQRQLSAIKKVVESGGKKAVSKAMVEAGFSEQYARNPKKLTKSKAWEKMMNKHLPDSLLAKKHKELLTVPVKRRTYIKGDLQSETEELDSQAVSKGLDMAYKLKGKYAPEKAEVDHKFSLSDLFKKAKDE